MNNARQWQVKEQVASHEAEKNGPILVKVAKRNRISKGEKLIYTLFSVVLIAACFYIVSYASKTDQLNREVLNLEQAVHNQTIENEALYFEVSELSSPERIINIAHKNGLKIQDAKVKRASQVNQ
ncbi:MAG TPA: cell division protein FtsL [Pseudogracilibacillus sp.]|nr:cell division protein FtsL [Pseudogracilibacillus sp.]